MANRFPLIANTTASQIQEIASGDFLDLSNSGISNSGNIFVSGIVSATGNITGGNLIFGSGIVSGTGNIYADKIFANIQGNIDAAGSNTQVQFNDTGDLLGASANFTFNKSTNTMTVSNGNIVGGNILTGGAISAAGNITGLNINSANADLAEMYVADSAYAPGTVVEFGGIYEITVATQSHSSRVAGIISTAPSYLMNTAQAGENVLPVALVGRVPCLVVGPITKGDCLVASSVQGAAQRLDPAQYQPACIVGKALEDYTSDQVGTIEVAVGRT
jgi:hypothetical protein